MGRFAALVMVGLGLGYFALLAPRPAQIDVSHSPDEGLAAVEGYWAALNDGDAVTAVSVLGVTAAQWEAEIGVAEFAAALERRFVTACVPDPGRIDVIVCELEAPPAGQPDSRPARFFESFFVRDGQLIAVERSEVAAVSDAVLARLGRLSDPVEFGELCADDLGPWLQINGVTYNEPCGRFLATVTSDGSWFPPDHVGLWLATGGS